MCPLNVSGELNSGLQSDSCLIHPKVERLVEVASGNNVEAKGRGQATRKSWGGDGVKS